MQYLRSIMDSLSNKFVRMLLVASMLLSIGFYAGRASRNRDIERVRQDEYSMGYQRSDTYGGGVDNMFSLTPTPAIPYTTANPQTYVVNRGDTIWGIADYLVKNDPRYNGWTTAGLKDEIIKLNPNINPKRMHRGNVLYLP